jgi:hypothetical protein
LDDVLEHTGVLPAKWYPGRRLNLMLVIGKLISEALVALSLLIQHTLIVTAVDQTVKYYTSDSV